MYQRSAETFFNTMKRAAGVYGHTDNQRTRVLGRIIDNELLKSTLGLLQVAATRFVEVSMREQYKNLDMAACFALGQWERDL